MSQPSPPTDHSLLVCLLALFLVNSPINQWWVTLPLPWYAMYLPWLLIIVFVAINQRRRHRNRTQGQDGGD